MLLFQLAALAAAASPCAPNGDLVALPRLSRTLHLRVTDGVGILTVTDVSKADPASAGLFSSGVFPATGTVVGARVRVGGHVVSATLDDEDAAATRFQDFLTALRFGVDPRDTRRGAEKTALLVEERADGCGNPSGVVSLQVATTCGHERMAAALELVIESEPVDGGWRFMLPRHPVHDVTLQVEGRAFVDGRPARGPVSLAAGEGEVIVDVVPPSGGLRGRVSVERLEPRASLSPLPHEGWGRIDGQEVVTPTAPVDAVRVEVDVPRPLSDPPASLRVVFVIDASKSAGEAGIAKARQAMEGVLDALPDDARYAVVAFARQPFVVVNPWTPRNERYLPALVPQNGSEVVDALALAQRIARDIAPDEVARVVLVSDLMTRAALDERAWANILDGGALTHVVALPRDLEPDDALTWARVLQPEEPARAAERTGGIVAQLDAFGDEDERTLWPHLIRPTRIDAVRVQLGGEDLLDAPIAAAGEIPGLLLEGQGVRVQVVLPATRSGRGQDASLTGLLWSQPFALPLASGEAIRKLSLARTASGPVARKLEDDIVRAAAHGAGAVSRTTSLVRLPAWRPPQPDGLPAWGTGDAGSCCGCTHGEFGFGVGAHGRSRSAPPLAGEVETLRAQLESDLELCQIRQGSVSVETEDQEVLDVRWTGAGRASTCLIERIWLWDLDELAEGLDPRAFDVHRSFDVAAELPED